MINPFYGEFLLHPSPLEYSGNTCSHNCAYCFSNIRRSCMYSEFKSTVSTIKKMNNGNSYTKKLLRNGYSVCISNRTDPFSKTNYRESIELFKYFANIENGIFFQTKGGTGVDESLQILKDKKNIVFYITITTLNPIISKKVEPGAPLPIERINLAKKVKGLGYEVIIAFNPIVEEWISDNEIYSLANELKKYGITHFIFQKLHLNKKDVNNFNEFRKKAFSDDTINQAINKKDKTSQLYLQNILETLRQDEFNVLAFGMPYKTKFFDDIIKTLGKSFPSNYYFFNSIKEDKKIYSFDDYYNSLITDNNEKSFWESDHGNISAYIMRVRRDLWKGNDKVQSIRTLKDVLKCYWNEEKLSGSPQNNFMFKKILNKTDNDGNILLYCDSNIDKINRVVTI